MLKETEQVQKRELPSFVSRAEMEKFSRELPLNVKEELKKGKLHYADTIIYSVKQISSNTVKMFETQDDREIGLRNIANAKLQKNQCLLVSGIQVLVQPTALLPGSNIPTKDAILQASVLQIDYCTAFLHGEFSFRANMKTIVPETSNKVFMSSSFTGYPPGYYKLHNPRLILDETLLEFTFELGTYPTFLRSYCVFVGLHGTITTP